MCAVIDATVGGNIAKIESFHYYHVTIRSNRNEDLYDGAIISQNFVLISARAAWVLRGSKIHVHVGTLSNSFSKGKIYPVDSVIIHPNFTVNNALDYNLALLRVQDPFEFDGTVNLIRLFDETNKKIRTKDVHNVTGYPCKSGDFDNYEHPMSLSLIVMSNEECKNLIKGTERADIPVNRVGTKQVFCVKLNDHEVANTCFDHYTGLVVANNSLAGIYSYTTNCNGQTCPVVYTKIYHHLDWLKSNSDVGLYLSK